jgi:tetratricopeptide (TPR) repeat protein
VRNTQVCLSLIVRDEEAVVGELLQSVVSIISSIAVVDTGSKDRTIEVIRNFAKAHRKRLVVEQQVWTGNFSFHRNASLQLAKTLLSPKGYVMVLDADERLAEPTDTTNALNRVDVLVGWLKQGEFRHQKAVLYRANKALEWRGHLHEQMIVQSDARYATRADLLIEYGDRGARRRAPDTHNADIKTLADVTKELGTTYRRLHFTALTLEAAGSYRRAVGFCTKAIPVASSPDEYFQAVWLRARSRHQLQSYRGAFRDYLELSSVAPHRAEGWVGLAQIAYVCGATNESVQYACEALRCAIPCDTVTFDRAAYTWLPKEILANATIELRQPKTRAADLLREALSLSPSDPADRSRIESSLFALKKR